MVKGKCNDCGKRRATSEYLIYGRGAVHSMKYCDDCEPKYETEQIVKIDGFKRKVREDIQ